MTVLSQMTWDSLRSMVQEGDFDARVLVVDEMQVRLRRLLRAVGTPYNGRGSRDWSAILSIPDHMPVSGKLIAGLIKANDVRNRIAHRDSEDSGGPTAREVIDALSAVERLHLLVTGDLHEIRASDAIAFSAEAFATLAALSLPPPESGGHSSEGRELQSLIYVVHEILNTRSTSDFEPSDMERLVKGLRSLRQHLPSLRHLQPAVLSRPSAPPRASTLPTPTTPGLVPTLDLTPIVRRLSELEDSLSNLREVIDDLAYERCHTDNQYRRLATAQIKSTWVDLGAQEADQSGLLIHVEFTVQGLARVGGSVRVKSMDGPAFVVSRGFLPTYDDALYDDFSVFIADDTLGDTTEVEVSISTLPDDNYPWWGFTSACDIYNATLDYEEVLL